MPPVARMPMGYSGSPSAILNLHPGGPPQSRPGPEYQGMTCEKILISLTK